MLPLISIIIPFHNAQEYLDRAVISAVKQSYPHLEIILIDSGSDDDSLQIAESLKALHSNIQIISIKEKSPGHARNVGIASAQGIYISFLDADDTLYEDAIFQLFNSLNECQSDLSIGKFNILAADDSVKKKLGWRLDGSLKTGVEGVLAMYSYLIAYTVWAKLFKANLVKQIHFPEGLWFEDRVFMLHYFLKSIRISFVDKSVLQYQVRPDSLTRQIISRQRIEDTYSIYLLELASIKGEEQESALKKVISRHQINSFLETLIFLYWDRSKTSDLIELQEVFNNTVKAFFHQLKTNNIPLGKRDRIDLQILRLNKKIGWNNTFSILPILKKKKCAAIKALRFA